MPNGFGHVLREFVHEPFGDGSIGAEDEAVVDLPPLAPAAVTLLSGIQAFHVQEALVGRVEICQRPRGAGAGRDGDPAVGEDLSGAEADGLPDCRPLQLQQLLPLLSEDVTDKSRPDIHGYSNESSMLYPLQPPNRDASGVTSTDATDSPVTKVQLSREVSSQIAPRTASATSSSREY